MAARHGRQLVHSGLLDLGMGVEIVTFEPKDPPRAFLVGNADKFEMRDCGTVRLEADEQVTFATTRGAEYDVARKSWGFYATPSLNGRLVQFGLRAVLVKNRGTGRFFVLLVESGEEALFERYCSVENLAVVIWLDSSAALEDLERRLDGV
jgi:hypothetical protein